MDFDTLINRMNNPTTPVPLLTAGHLHALNHPAMQERMIRGLLERPDRRRPDFRRLRVIVWSLTIQAATYRHRGLWRLIAALADGMGDRETLERASWHLANGAGPVGSPYRSAVA